MGIEYKTVDQLIKEFSIITVDIIIGEDSFLDGDAVLIDDGINYPQCWYFDFVFQHKFKVSYSDYDSDLPYNRDYLEYLDNLRLSFYREVNEEIENESSAFSALNKLVDYRTRFKELLSNYSVDTYYAWAKKEVLKINKLVKKTCNDEKKGIKDINYSRILNSFLTVQISTLEYIIQYLNEKITIVEKFHSSKQWLQKKQSTINTIPKINLPQLASDEIVIKSFLWARKVTFKSDILLFFELLTQYEIIPRDTDFGNFCDAFSGKSLLNPLKIKWLVVGKNKQTSKSSLFHLFSRLEDNKLIESKDWNEKNNMPLYKKISIVFADKNGKLFSIDGLKSSRTQGLDSDCAKQSVIDSIVNKVARLSTANKVQ